VNGDGEIRTKGVVLATKLNFDESWYVSGDITRNWLDTKTARHSTIFRSSLPAAALVMTPRRNSGVRNWLPAMWVN
ncbi:hypothetical protein, partial [Serratia marcescens]|uniref:hypothetical protein n=1 Tax=Serratia marcescens TaxID=615 RepID=UPI001EF7B41D